MPNEDQQTTTLRNQGDNLEAIQGIGRKFAEALQRASIRHFTDFAHYTPVQLADHLLNQTGVKVPPQRIATQDWLGQAAALARQTAVPPNPTPAADANTATPAYEQADDCAWIQQAGFLLFFDYMGDEHGEPSWQTRTYHHETGEEAQFAGIAPVPWVEWILKQANLLDVVSPASMPVQPPPAEALKLALVDASIEEAPEALARNARNLIGTIHFRLSGAKAAQVVAEERFYQVECHLHDPQSGASQLCALTRAALQPETFEYRCPQSFPDMGTYELQWIVLLLPPAEALAVYHGPNLHVLP